MIQAFGFTNWNATASANFIGRADALRACGASALRYDHARYSKYAVPNTFNTRAAAGSPMSKAPTPLAQTNSSSVKPTATPSRCGRVRLKPNTTPEADNIRLFGPGVIDDTNAKLTSGSNSSMTVPPQREVASYVGLGV